MISFSVKQNHVILEIPGTLK